MNPAVCLAEEGKGTRQPLWFTAGPGPAEHWPRPKLVIAPQPSVPPVGLSLFPSLILLSHFLFAVYVANSFLLEIYIFACVALFFINFLPLFLPSLSAFYYTAITV